MEGGDDGVDVAGGAGAAEFLGIGLSMAALAYADVTVATVLNATSPLFVLPLWALVSGERIGPRAVAGALAAVAGVAILLTG